MKYIKFYNVITESMYDGFLVEQDGKNYTTVDPICYEWIHQTGNWHWFEHLEARTWDTEFFSYQEATAPEMGHFIREYDWLFHFPVKDEYLNKIHSIANFFEWFAGTKQTPLQEKLALCKSRTKHVLSTELAQEICDFIVNHYRNHPDRLRILLNGE